MSIENIIVNDALVVLTNKIKQFVNSMVVNSMVVRNATSKDNIYIIIQCKEKRY